MQWNSNDRVFVPNDFEGAELVWDALEIDPDGPLDAQLGEFDYSLIWMLFPNGCGVEIEWKTYHEDRSHFLVTLTQVPVGGEWEAIEWRDCYSVAELRAAVRELVTTAKGRPSIPTLIFGQGSIGLVIDPNDLILDQTIPPEQQLDRLRGELFEASLDIGGTLLRVGWEPPHDANGQFIVRVVRYLHDLGERLDDLAAGRTPPIQVLAERRCQTIAAMKQHMRELEREHSQRAG